MSAKTATLPPQSETLARPRSVRVLTVEFWRFAFTVLVCLYHSEMYFGSPKLMPSGSSAVEFFFVLAGFLMAKSAKRNLTGRDTSVSVREAHAKALDFVKKKLKAFYPVLIVVLLLGILVYPTFQSTFIDRLKNLQNTEWEMLMLVGTPFGYNDGMTPIVPLWFLTGLLIVGYIYTFALYKNYDFMMFAAPVLGILFYVYFTLNSTLVLDFYVKMGFLNAGMVRAVAEISLGVSVYALYEYLSKKKFGKGWRIVLSLLELYAIYRLFSLMFFQPAGMDNFKRILYIMIIVLLSFLNKTFFTWLLNRKIWAVLGKITFTMYLCHFHLVNVYLSLLSSWKSYLLSQSMTSPSAYTMWQFLQGTGGTDSTFKSIPITFKDAVLYMILVIAVSTLIHLYILFWKKMIIRPAVEYIKKRQSKKAALAELEEDLQ